jgi:hypothetical protein
VAELQHAEVVLMAANDLLTKRSGLGAQQWALAASRKGAGKKSVDAILVS